MVVVIMEDHTIVAVQLPMEIPQLKIGGLSHKFAVNKV